MYIRMWWGNHPPFVLFLFFRSYHHAPPSLLTPCPPYWIVPLYPNRATPRSGNLGPAHPAAPTTRRWPSSWPARSTTRAPSAPPPSRSSATSWTRRWGPAWGAAHRPLPLLLLLLLVPRARRHRRRHPPRLLLPSVPRTRRRRLPRTSRRGVALPLEGRLLQLLLRRQEGGRA